METGSTRATRRRLLRWGSAGGAALAGTALVGGLHTDVVAAQTSDPIVGSWIGKIASADGSSDLTLTSFTGDGLVFASSSPYNAPDPTQGSPASYATQGQGSWKKTGTGSYHLTFVEISYDEMGNAQGTATIAATVQLSSDGQSLSAGFGLHVALLDGTVIMDVPEPQAGTVQAKRIPA